MHTSSLESCLCLARTQEMTGPSTLGRPIFLLSVILLAKRTGGFRRLGELCTMNGQEAVYVMGGAYARIELLQLTLN